MIKVFILVILVYLLLVAGLFVFQRNILFVPGKVKPETVGTLVPEMQEVFLHTSDGLSLTSWFYRGEPDKHIIIYFQGNAGTIRDRDYKARFFMDRGYGVLLVGYRGYGKNPGKPSEWGLTLDGEAAIEFAKKEAFTTDRIILYGESLGTGVVVNLASKTEVNSIILEAPYTSIEHIAKHRYWFIPVRYLLKDRFDSIKKIGSIKIPGLVLHGDQDRVISVSYGEELFQHMNEPKQFIKVPGGRHSDLFDYGVGEEIIKFVEGM
ncbi:MAG: hypothetical protein CMM58_06290 [Rhodospirillaceae bacterium]|nr:hypothetical protein [Rhodospirillaceae bacterium]